MDQESVIQSLTPNDVLVAYKGVVGCMCGCRGSFTVNERHLDEAQAARGYPYTAAERVNQDEIVRILRLLQADARTEIDMDAHCAVMLDTDNDVTLCVYLTLAAAERIRQ